MYKYSTHAQRFCKLDLVSLRRNHLTSEVKGSRLPDRIMDGTNDRQNESIAIAMKELRSTVITHIIQIWLYIRVSMYIGMVVN